MDENTSGTVVMGTETLLALVNAWQAWLNAQRKGAPRLELIAAEQALRDIANATD